MNETNLNPEDARLRDLLRATKATPALPPRFQENVWRRVERSESRDAGATWIELLIARMLRPKLALAMVAVVVAGGAFLGVREGVREAREEAQIRYVAVVNPSALH